MPYNANEARRHRIFRARYQVTNWPACDWALQQRGSLTVWMTPEALAAWHPPRTGQLGQSRRYSDVAIETGHLLRLAFGRPWCRPKVCCARLQPCSGWRSTCPTTRSSPGAAPGGARLPLARSLARAQRTGPVHLVNDAIGLKVYGAGEWLAEARQAWQGVGA